MHDLITPAGIVLVPAADAVELRTLLHAVDPYAGFDAAAHPFDPQGWNGESELFGRLVAEVRPRIAIEVGSWKGQSAITTARHLQALGAGAQLLCVDTWLGSVDFWLTPGSELNGALQLVHGYPSVYYQFLANVVHAGLQDVITPFPAPSVIAARLLILRGVRAELIYIDASHEENDVYMDIVYYWQTLRPGGIMFGDDYSERFMPGVVRAVRAFCAEQNLQCEIVDDQYWVVRKPVR
jgi:predicted O-methyltransferase YrrM